MNEESPLSYFLHSIPRDALKHLRDVTAVKDISLRKSVQHEWVYLVRFINTHMDVSKLTLVLDVSLWDALEHAPDPVPSKYAKRQNYRMNHEYNVVRKMVEAMSRYNTWKAVIIHLSWGAGLWEYDEGREREESALEAIVMGDSYNSYAYGKVYRHCSCDDVVEEVVGL